MHKGLSRGIAYILDRPLGPRSGEPAERLRVEAVAWAASERLRAALQVEDVDSAFLVGVAAAAAADAAAAGDPDPVDAGVSCALDTWYDLAAYASPAWLVYAAVGSPESLERVDLVTGADELERWFAFLPEPGLYDALVALLDGHGPLLVGYVTEGWIRPRPRGDDWVALPDGRYASPDGQFYDPYYVDLELVQ